MPDDSVLREGGHAAGSSEIPMDEVVICVLDDPDAAGRAP